MLCEVLLDSTIYSSLLEIVVGSAIPLWCMLFVLLELIAIQLVTKNTEGKGCPH